MVEAVKHDIADKRHLDSTVTSILTAPKMTATLLPLVFLGLRTSQHKYYGFGSSTKSDLTNYILNYISALKRNLNISVTLTTRINSLLQLIIKTNGT
jgi:hypothetical protein